MSLKSIIECSVCKKTKVEATAGEGFYGWGSLQGVEMNGEVDPMLCPIHLAQVANHLDEIIESGKE